jgi:hypothetical protein
MERSETIAQRLPKGHTMPGSEEEVRSYHLFCSHRHHYMMNSSCHCFLQTRMRAISEIVNALVAGVKAGHDVDLNVLKRDVNAKYALARAPKLVEIIAALPEERRGELLPR